MLEGSGGNIAVLTGPDGKVLVDAGIAVSRPQVAAALAELGPEPVTHLINTHWHFDHANGNEWLHELGPQILAQENTLKHLSTMQRVEDWDYDFAPLSAAALPTDVFATERTLKLNGTTLALKYYGPAHTDSDISVQFTEADILHTGDTFWNGIYPFIDYSTGGSIDGSIRAADADLAATTDKTIIIPGHGPPVSNRVRAAGLPRHAGRHSRQRRSTQAAGPVAGGDRRGQADRGLRRQMGPVRDQSRLVHQAGLRGRLITGTCTPTLPTWLRYAYIGSAGSLAMAINGAWNKRSGPGGSARRLHHLGKSAKHGGDTGSTRAVKMYLSLGMVPPLSGHMTSANDNTEALAVAA